MRNILVNDYTDTMVKPYELYAVNVPVMSTRFTDDTYTLRKSGYSDENVTIKGISVINKLYKNINITPENYIKNAVNDTYLTVTTTSITTLKIYNSNLTLLTTLNVIITDIKKVNFYDTNITFVLNDNTCKVVLLSKNYSYVDTLDISMYTWYTITDAITVNNKVILSITQGSDNKVVVGFYAYMQETLNYIVSAAVDMPNTIYAITYANDKILACSANALYAINFNLELCQADSYITVASYSCTSPQTLQVYSNNNFVFVLFSGNNILVADLVDNSSYAFYTNYVSVLLLTKYPALIVNSGSNLNIITCNGIKEIYNNVVDTVVVDGATARYYTNSKLYYASIDFITTINAFVAELTEINNYKLVQAKLVSSSLVETLFTISLLLFNINGKHYRNITKEIGNNILTQYKV